MKPEEYRQRLSQKLLGLIEENEWSIRDLARMAGINPTSMSSYATAMAYPTKENREKIARGIFKISLDELDAQIEDRPVSRERTTEDVCREIRLMDDAEFLEVREEVDRQTLIRFRRHIEAQG